MLDDITKKRINSLRKILVGKLPDPKAQVEQITNGLIYKFMNDMDEQSVSLGGKATYFSGKFEKYSWQNLMNPKTSGSDRLELYKDAIEKMYNNENLPELFREIFKNSFLPFKDPSTLNMFLKEINEFSYSHSEKLGDAFEYLLSFMGSQGDAGQFRTPRHIIEFIVEVVNPKKNETILDPACGTSGFLISSYKHILNKNTKKNLGDKLSASDRKKIGENLNGYDISPDMTKMSLVNMYLHKFSNPKISEYDTLSSEEKWNEYYDVVLGNPPFFSPTGGITPHNRFRVKSKRAEVLFIDYIDEHLKPNGRAGIIVPEGILFKDDSGYIELRKNLLKNSLVGIVSLPSGIFEPYSGQKTNIIFLDKQLANNKKDIFFAEIQNDGFALTKTRRPIEKNDLPDILECLKNLDNINENKNIFLVDKKKIYDNKKVLFTQSEYKKKDNINNNKFVKITEVFETITPKIKIKKRDFKTLGKIPIVDQSDKFISGYSNNERDCVNLDSPVIVFGDHTRKVKYIDFRFLAGADGIKILKPVKNKILPKYLYFMLKNLNIKNLGYSRHFKELKKLQILLPNLEIQEQIVRELDSYEKVISGCEQIIQNFNTSIEIKKEWKMEVLEKEIDFISGLTIQVDASQKKNGIPIITMADITKNGFIEKLNLRKVDTKGKKYNLLQKGDLLFNWRNGSPHLVGKTGYFDLEGDFVFASFSQGIRVKKRLLSKFLWIILNQYRREGLYMGLMRKNINGLFNRDEIKKLKVPIPDIEIQKKIIADIDEQINLVENNNKIIEIFKNKILNKIKSLEVN